MPCNILFDQNNNVVRVDAENGSPSLLYTAISTNPLLSQEQSLDAYKNIYSDAFEKIKGKPHPIKTDENGEPILYFKTPNGSVFTTYREALNATQSGSVQGIAITTDNISYDRNSKADVVISNDTIILNNQDAVSTLFNINSNSNSDTLQGFINQQIRLNQISDTTLNGRLTGELNGMLAIVEAQGLFGKSNVTAFEDGTFEINYTPSNVIRYGTEEITKEKFLSELKAGNFEGLVRRMGRETAVGSAYNLYREKNSIFRDNKVIEQMPTTFTEEQLSNSLKGFLNRLGVNLTSIEDYIQHYTDKNNVPPTAEALADIANKVIAYANGEISIEALTEETAHFAVEAYQDQDTLNRMLESVHLTNEWAQDSQRYLEVYGRTYQGAELDNIVRREILGKILARKLKENFANTQNTPVEAGFSNLLRQLWETVITRIRALILPSMQTELEGFTDSIANNILDDNFDDLFSESTLSKSQFVLFSLGDKRVSSRLQKYYRSLQKLNDQLKKSKTGNLDTTLNQAEELLRNTEALDNAESWMVVQYLNSSLSRPLNDTVRIVEDALQRYNNGDTNQNKLYLDGRTISTIAELADTKDALQQVIAVIENNVLQEVEAVNRNAILSELKNKLEQINKLERDRDFLNIEDGTGNILDKISAVFNIPQNYVDKLKELVGQETKDITWMTRIFGQPAFANNPFINILSKIFAVNNVKANTDTQRQIDPFLNYISENSFGLSDFRAIVETDEKGNPTGRMISDRHIDRFYADLEAEKTRIVQTFLPDETSPQKLNPAQRQQYDTQIRNWINANTERQFEDSYYEAREQATAFMSPETKQFLKGLSERRFAITNKYKKGEAISDVDQRALESISADRKSAKSLYNDDRTMKQPDTIEYQIAQDLIRSDKEFAQQNKDKVYILRQEFTDNLRDIESAGTKEANKESLKWIIANGGLRFGKSFWDALGTRAEEGERQKEPKIVKRLRDSLDNVAEQDADVIEDLANNLERLLNTRSDLLRKYQKAGNPSEVDVATMTDTAKNSIKELDVEIQKAFQQANTILKRNSLSEIESPQVETENTVNQSYYEDLKKSGIQESDFIYQNVSKDDQVNITKFVRKIDDLQTGLTDNIEPKYNKFFADYFQISEVLEQDEFTEEVIDRIKEMRNIEPLLLAYSRTKLYSYYKRFAPKGYSDFLKDLQEGKIVPSRLLNDREALQEEYQVSQYVEITPNYTWNENTSENEKNPNYEPNWEGGIYQPKISKYRNDSYIEKFGINSEGQATRNSREFEMLQLFREANRIAYTNNGLQIDVNKLPQFSKSTVQKIAESLRVGVGETIKRSFKDAFMNRIDDMDYGQQDLNSSQNVVPIMGVYDLEEKSDVSLDLALTFSELIKQSNLHKYRKDSLSAVMAIRQQIAEQKFTNGKTGDASNAYQMADNFIQANIFGVRQTRKMEVNIGGYKIDLARLALVLHKRLQFASLGFSPVIALTNYFTGYLQLNVTESLLGEFINANSNLYATKEFNTKELPQLITDTGKINRRSKAYKLLESAGSIDLNNRLSNSNIGRLGTAFTRMGWVGFLMGDISLKSKVFIATFDDLRSVEDVGFMTYNQYKLRPEHEGLTKAAIKEKWDTLRDKSLWNALENEGTSPLRIKQEFIDLYGQEKMDAVLSDAKQKAAATAAQIDGQMTETERIAASRDPLLRFATSMRGWLFSIINRRFQGRKYSLLQGQEIEGSYITTGSFLNNIVRKMIDDRGIRNLISIVKQEWADADTVKRNNMKRALADFGLFLSLLSVSLLAMAGDDDDDPYLYTFASYILLRTTSETSSMGAISTSGAIIDALQDPLLSVSFLKELWKADFFGDIESPSSQYQGMNKTFALLIKNSPLKQIYTLSDIRTTRDNYRAMNQNLWFLSSNKKTEEVLNYFGDDSLDE